MPQCKSTFCSNFFFYNFDKGFKNTKMLIDSSLKGPGLSYKQNCVVKGNYRQKI